MQTRPKENACFAAQILFRSGRATGYATDANSCPSSKALWARVKAEPYNISTSPAALRLLKKIFPTYGAILIDPPWQFETWSTKGKGRSADRHYKTTPAEELEKLEIPAADDAALFMWVVDAHMPEALKLIETWGFTYKTVAFIWVKPSIGLGYWSRKQAELCLLATRGKPKRLSGGVRQIIEAPRREHSRKPDETYERIEQLVGGPYLEMFARQRWPGWDSWGNETGKF